MKVTIQEVELMGFTPVTSLAESATLAHETMSIPGFLGPLKAASPRIPETSDPFPHLFPASDTVGSV